MHLSRTFAAAAIAFACGSACPAFAAVAWDETSRGDLSGDGLAPTDVGMDIGSNAVLGTTGDSGQGIDRDYFRFVVPDGAMLTVIVLLGNTSVSGSSSFIGLQAGPQLTVSPTGAGAASLLGFAHYGSDQIGHDILPAMAINFSGALPSGTYAVWVQELGGPVSYGFDFVITPVSEPATAVLLLAGLLGLATHQHRRPRDASGPCRRITR